MAPPEKIQAWRDKMSANVRAYWTRLPPSKQQLIINHLHDVHSRWLQGLTPEEKQQISERKSKVQLQRWGEMSQEERNRAIDVIQKGSREWRARQSPEDLAAKQAEMTKGFREWYNGISDSKKAAWNAKRLDGLQQWRESASEEKLAAVAAKRAQTPSNTLKRKKEEKEAISPPAQPIDLTTHTKAGTPRKLTKAGKPLKRTLEQQLSVVIALCSTTRKHKCLHQGCGCSYDLPSRLKRHKQKFFHMEYETEENPGILPSVSKPKKENKGEKDEHGEDNDDDVEQMATVEWYWLVRHSRWGVDSHQIAEV